MKSELNFKKGIKKYAESILEQEYTMSPDVNALLKKIDSFSKTLLPYYEKIESSQKVCDFIVAMIKPFKADDKEKLQGLTKAISKLSTKDNKQSQIKPETIEENKRTLFLAGLITEAQYRK